MLWDSDCLVLLSCCLVVVFLSCQSIRARKENLPMVLNGPRVPSTIILVFGVFITVTVYMTVCLCIRPFWRDNIWNTKCETRPRTGELSCLTRAAGRATAGCRPQLLLDRAGQQLLLRAGKTPSLAAQQNSLPGKCLALFIFSTFFLSTFWKISGTENIFFSSNRNL